MTIAPPLTPAEAPAKVKTTADVLRHAAWIIEERGWTQGLFEDYSTGAVCALGAIGLGLGLSVQAWGIGPTQQRAVQEVADHLGYGWGLQGWNDTPGRTAAEVTAALRAAADASERAS